MRRFVYGAALIALAAAGLKITWPQLQQIRYLCYQQTLLWHCDSADTIVYTNDHVNHEKMLKRGSFLDEYYRDKPAGVGGVPYGGFIFAHGRSAIGRPERLVVVELDFGGGIMDAQRCLGAWADDLATMAKDSRLHPDDRAEFLMDRFSITSNQLLFSKGLDRWTIYAGQPDPIDESHFTIGYELDGKSDIIDGWLMPDDTVKMQARHAWK